MISFDFQQINFTLTGTLKAEKIPAQRRKLILTLLRDQGVLSVHEISRAVGVSLPTIRRDLDWLARTGAIDRSHGGASAKSSPSTTFEPDYHVSARMARDEKQAIGLLGADRIRENQSVIFDSSSTVFEAARLFAARGISLTAVTNDIRIGQLFAACPLIRLIVCGGTIRPGSYTLIGEPGAGFLRQLHVDVAVMGIHAVKGTACCDTSLEIAYTKRYMAQAANKVLLLADSSKFEQVAFFEAFTLDEKFEIITDRGLPKSLQRNLEKHGATVTLASPDPARAVS